LAGRYGKPGPRKLLALDGGGIRGLITLGFLARLEKLLRNARGAGESFRLCDYFDYIGGTSTGAIIAACLARGMSVEEVQAFYVDAGPQMFESSELLRRLSSLYKADPLQAKLQATFGALDLAPANLRCLLLVVTRNVTTDSPWPISSNPEARYNDPSRADCNLRVPLWKIVRASTAAPIYFPPETVNWDPRDDRKTFTFVDGGVTPYNNPAFLLYRMATHPAYQLSWAQGERNLQIVSIGTGAANTPSFKANFNIATNLVGLPGILMYGMQVDQDINCRTAGRCTYGDLIDREVRDLTCRDINEPCTIDAWTAAPHLPLSRDLGRAFLYTRYNAELTQEALNNLSLSNIEASKVQKMDAVDQIDNLIRIGRASAESQIDLAHLGDFVSQ
jgi:patatin-like phospholipase/acyl hydrolase